MEHPASKRESMLRLLDGGWGGEGAPAAFFMHFGAGYHFGPAAVARHVEFFRATGMDLAKIQLELPFPLAAVERPADWARLTPFDDAFLAPHVELVRGIVRELGAEAVVVSTLYSPFMVAGRMGGTPTLVRHLEEDPAPVAEGLAIVAEGLARLGRACLDAGLDGFYHSTQGGEDGRFRAPGVFERWIKPSDLALLEQIGPCRFNILHVCDYHSDEVGRYADLAPFAEYPGHVVCAPTEGLGLAGVARLFGRPVLGGMDRLGALAHGPEEAIRAAARAVLASAPERFVLGADCTVPDATPWDNLRAAVDEAHRWQA